MRAKKGVLLSAVIAVQILLKLWLVHDHEIRACDYPSDDPWYVTSALHGYWLGSFQDSAFARPPAYPLWIAFSRAIGVPLRLSTELLYLGAAAALSASLWLCGLPWTLAAASFGLVAFHPFSVHVNDGVMPDALYAPALLFSAAGMLAVLARRGGLAAAIGTGFACSVLWFTRQESQLVLVHVAIFAGIAFWTWKRIADSPRADAARAAAWIALPIFCSIACVRVANAVTFRSFAEHELAMPGFLAAYRALLRIDAAPARRYVPVGSESLEAAFRASPSMGRLRPYFDGDPGRTWQTFTPGEAAGRGQIGGQFAWALGAATRWAGKGRSAPEAEAFYHSIADEIDGACRSGALRCRPATLASLERLWHGVPDLGPSFVRVSSMLVWHAPRFATRCSPPHRAETIALFDLGCGRRARLTRTSLSLGGWVLDASDPADAVRRVSFRDGGGRILASTQDLSPRADVEKAYGPLAGSSPPLRPGFDLLVPSLPDDEPAGALVFTLQSGRDVTVDAATLSTIALGSPVDAGDAPRLLLSLETRRTDRAGRPIQERILSVFLARYRDIVVALAAASLAALGFLAWRRDGRGPDRSLLAAALLLAAIGVARLLLFVGFDAVVWPGSNPRFLYPVAALFPCAALVFTTALLRRSPKP